jgi:hypothetical protein
MTTKNDLTIQIDPSIFTSYNPGDRVYIISWFNESFPSQERFRIQDNMPYTNRGVQRAEGWLGCTNSINETAHGLYEIEELHLVKRLSKDEIAGKRRPEAIATKVVLSKISE